MTSNANPNGSNAITTAIKEANAAIRFAVRLGLGAKFFVEALIEGRITDAELAAAQQALDSGDPAPDRALLTRLTRAGFDLPGDMLFPDLEALATTLAQVSNEEATACP